MGGDSIPETLAPHIVAAIAIPRPLSNRVETGAIHTVEVKPLTSGLHGIRILKDGQMDGGADPRREGTVVEVTEQ